MNVKALLRTLVFLLILFVVIYVGTENTQAIDFRFPLLLSKPVHASAAWIYFAVFAVGVFGGTLLHSGGGGGSGRK
jgi:hypothetical protein